MMALSLVRPAPTVLLPSLVAGLGCAEPIAPAGPEVTLERGDVVFEVADPAISATGGRNAIVLMGQIQVSASCYAMERPWVAVEGRRVSLRFEAVQTRGICFDAAGVLPFEAEVAPLRAGNYTIVVELARSGRVQLRRELSVVVQGAHASRAGR